MACDNGRATYIPAGERGNFLEDEGLQDACLQMTSVHGVELFWRGPISCLQRTPDTGLLGAPRNVGHVSETLIDFPCVSAENCQPVARH